MKVSLESIKKRSVLIFLGIVCIYSCGLKNKTTNSDPITTAEKGMEELIGILVQDSALHKNIGTKLKSFQIKEGENRLGIVFPESFKSFLKKFGNGAYWMYHVDQPINGLGKKHGEIHRLGKYRKFLGDIVESDGFGTFKTNTLLCLMTENSNGGA